MHMQPASSPHLPKAVSVRSDLPIADQRLSVSGVSIKHRSVCSVVINLILIVFVISYALGHASAMCSVTLPYARQPTVDWSYK